MTLILRKVVLVGGSGHLGPYLLKALQANPAFEVTVISRQSSKAVFPPDTNVVKIDDAYPKSEILGVFRGKDAVVLSLNWTAEAQHHNMLVDASVEAGVKRLIPSMWAGRLDIPEAREIFPLAAMKTGLLEYVKSKSALGWSYTAISCGLFMDMCVQTNFFGFDPVAHTGKIWDDGAQTFSATNRDTIGLAVTNILSNPGETANKTVYISSFEPSMNNLLAAYKEATGVADWKIGYGEVDQGIKEAQEKSQTSQDFMEKMRAMGLLGLLVGLKKGLGADFVAEGISDNEMLGLPHESVAESVKKNIPSVS